MFQKRNLRGGNDQGQPAIRLARMERIWRALGGRNLAGLNNASVTLRFFLGDRRITNFEEAGFRLGKHTRNVKIR
jgi:hypothetical protein